MDFSPDRVSFFVNPDFREMAGDKHAIIDPATLETVGYSAVATEAEIDATLTVANEAQAEWKRLDAKSRAKHLHAVDRFVDLLAERTRKLRTGNGMAESEIGPVVSEAARAKVMRLVDDAVANGAKAVAGGRVPPSRNVGWFYEPTILTGVTPEMAICREECFGPVAAICRVSDFDEAIRLANDSPFGLGASVFTTDLEEAMEAAERLEAGMVWINNPLIDNDALPFGGWKASGLGRELGRQGLDAFRRSKMVVIDHKPTIQGRWYPYPDSWFPKHGGRKHV